MSDITREHDSTVVLQLTSSIVSAYVSRNEVDSKEIPGLIGTVFNQMASLAGQPSAGVTALSAEASRPPAVDPKKSVFPEYIICLEDGRKMKMLKRHLMTAYNLTPEQYRAKWGLPGDYPIVAPGYSAIRSGLAKASGLGVTKAIAPAGKKKVTAKGRK